MTIFGACSGSGPERTVPAPAPSPMSTGAHVAVAVVVDVDTPMTTPSGATYVAPKGWWVTTKAGVVVLEDSNREMSVMFLERKEEDGEAAIASAWQEVQPGFYRAAAAVTPGPGRGGWDARLRVSYETATANGRLLSADAKRKGDTWFVALSEGTREGWARSESQAKAARESFRAKGVVEESFAGKKANVLDAARLASLEAFIEEGRLAAKIPGVAVAVVQDGRVVLAKGFGVRELGKADRVTPDTSFRIASITKPLTSLMIAALVGEGTLAWDTRVTALYPAFALGDRALTNKLTIHDMLGAVTGIPYDNLGSTFEYEGISPERWLGRMNVLVPTKGFGEAIQESNPMIAAAGYIAAHAFDPRHSLSTAYERAMREKVFVPLGMTRTTFDPRVVAKGERAAPHVRDARGQWVVPRSDPTAWFTVMNPGVGAWSTVSDLAKLLAMELANGKAADGKRIFAEAALLARREPQTHDKNSYGLGLYLDDNRGVRVVGTAGHAVGYTSSLFFLPDHGVAAVMLTNVELENPLPGRFQRRLMELLFDGRDEAREDLALDFLRVEASFAKDMSRIDFAPGRAFFEPFAGTYDNALCGTISIRIEGDGAVLDAGEWKTALGRERGEDGSERLVGAAPPWLGWPSLARKEEGGKVTLRMGDAKRPVVFERKGKS